MQQQCNHVVRRCVCDRLAVRAPGCLPVSAVASECAPLTGPVSCPFGGECAPSSACICLWLSCYEYLLSAMITHSSHSLTHQPVSWSVGQFFSLSLRVCRVFCLSDAQSLVAPFQPAPTVKQTKHSVYHNRERRGKNSKS